MRYIRSLGDRWTPLFLFNALAAGALALTFYCHLTLLFWTRGNAAIVVFPTMQKLFTAPSLSPMKLGWLFAMTAGFLWFFADHARLMLWNKRQERQTSPSLRAIKPLSWMVTLILAFITAALLIPGLWPLREYLFPLVLVGFGVGLFYSFKTLPATQPFATLENIALLAACAIGFSMIVIFTRQPTYAYMGFFLSLLCLAGIFFITIKAGFSGLGTTLREIKSPVEKATLLWLCVLLLALLAVALQRLDLALVVGMHGANTPLWSVSGLAFALSFMLFLSATAFQTSRTGGFFALIQRQDSFSVGSYSLVLGLIGLFLVGHFFILNALVASGFMELFSLGFWIAYMPLIAVQAAAIAIYLKLNAKLFKGTKGTKGT